MRTAVGDSGPGAKVTGRDRRLTGLVLATLVLVVATLASLAFGSRSIPLETVVSEFLDRSPGLDGTVLWDQRLPRTLLGLAAGAALGVVGALMQALTRNPLADPGILGVNAGAATAIVLAMAVLGLTELPQYIWFGVLGAGVASLLVYAIGSTGPAGASPVRLALAGTAVTATLTAFVAAMVVLNPVVFDNFRNWEVGSLAGRGTSTVLMVSAVIAPTLLLAWFLAAPLNAIALGEDSARSLGLNLNRTRLATAVLIMVLCGVATAAVGPIAFVGLTVPHAARAFTGPDQRWIIPYALILGAALVLLADTVGRVIDAPSEIPAGAMTAFIGAPVFIALVRRRRIARL